MLTNIASLRLLGKIVVTKKEKLILEECLESSDKFGIAPREKGDEHRPFNKEIDLERLFARKAARKISKDLSFSYEGVSYQINTDPPNRFTKTHVNILDRPGKPLLIECDGKNYFYKKWGEQPSQKPKVFDSKQLEVYWRKTPIRKPKKKHPWR